ncbi:MAG: hypothetical protein IPI43_25975 [Sandaracinaceae bacterium]|jgi:hypothetical protein|nr:hypothetical protein [Sandaracinaceae bacterium]
MSGDVTRIILEFLETIGLEVRSGSVEHETPLPGIALSDGVIVVDHARLRFPGDLLHEAGHLAVLPAAARGAPVTLDSPGDEMASIAWSYAAALHLDLDPAVVFHEHGYRGDSPMILENFAAGRTFGVPLLAWYGLCDTAAYPAMERWLRE